MNSKDFMTFLLYNETEKGSAIKLLDPICFARHKTIKELRLMTLMNKRRIIEDGAVVPEHSEGIER